MINRLITVKTLILKKIKVYFFKGFTMIEVMIGVSIFTIFITSIIWGFMTLIKLEIKSKQNIYEHIQKTNTLSEEYYIKLK
jgi:prepilin-type N-terminal cleavage/methylation domain-containing protein